MLNLFVAEGQDPPAGITRLMRPFGKLLGVALENERLTRENLQARLAAERQSMAADVHDALAQSLTFMRMRMTLLDTAIRDGDCGHAHAYAGDVSEELRNAHGRLREMISLYRAGMDSRGLVASLRELAAAFRRRSGIELVFDCPVQELDLPADQQLQSLLHRAGGTGQRHPPLRRAHGARDGRAQRRRSARFRRGRRPRT